MSNADLPTPIQFHLDRHNAGDPQAREELLRITQDRLLAITRKIMNQFPDLKRWERSDGVLQLALERINRMLIQTRIETRDDYFRLAGRNIRWAVDDLIRHYKGPEGIASHHATPDPNDPNGGPVAVAPDRDDPERLARIAEIHAEVGRLPAELLDVVNLRFYFQLTIEAIVAELGISESTVKRRLEEAFDLLRKKFGPDGLNLI